MSVTVIQEGFASDYAEALDEIIESTSLYDPDVSIDPDAFSTYVVELSELGESLAHAEGHVSARYAVVPVNDQYQQFTYVVYLTDTLEEAKALADKLVSIE